MSVSLCLTLFLAGGCEKSAPRRMESLTVSPTNAIAVSAPADPVSSFHWLGKKRIAVDTNAAGLMPFWNLPEAEKLQAQTLDKLATVPSRIRDGWGARPALTNTAVALLRPLLDDLLQEEVYAEMRHLPAGTWEVALAVRTGQDRDLLWRTNLSSVMKSLTGIDPVADSAEPFAWVLAKHDFPNRLEYCRAGEWSVVGLAQDTNRLVREFQVRIRDNGLPFVPSGSNCWISAAIQSNLLQQTLGKFYPGVTNLPRIQLTMFGDGINARTRAEIFLPQPVATSFPVWNLPTNLVRQPLASFTAARGLGGLLRYFDPSNSVARFIPSEIYLWDRSGPPLQTYFSFPFPQATNVLAMFAPQITNWISSSVDTEKFGHGEIGANSSIVEWVGLPFAAPFLKATDSGGREVLYGGFGFSPAKSTNRLPTELARHITDKTNLAWFEWEMTAERVAHVRYFDDLTKIIFDKKHVPSMNPQSASLRWLGGAITNLSHSVTEIELTSPHQLALRRKSSMGLSAIELAVVMNWLESPNFPAGYADVLRLLAFPGSVSGSQPNVNRVLPIK